MARRFSDLDVSSAHVALRGGWNQEGARPSQTVSIIVGKDFTVRKEAADRSFTNSVACLQQGQIMLLPENWIMDFAKSSDKEVHWKEQKPGGATVCWRRQGYPTDFRSFVITIAPRSTAEGMVVTCISLNGTELASLHGVEDRTWLQTRALLCKPLQRYNNRMLKFVTPNGCLLTPHQNSVKMCDIFDILDSPESHSTISQALPAEVEDQVFVTKWVDYSTKYGIGYILSDGCIGVYFNDSTKIISHPEGSQFDYETRRAVEKKEERSTHTLEKYPVELKKKVTLLRHFKDYMMAEDPVSREGATNGKSSLRPSASAKKAAYEPGQAPFVKKWVRYEHAILFQLSNTIVQVSFFDKTELLLSSKARTVTYIDKQGQVQLYALDDALASPTSTELSKRLRYAKEMLQTRLGTRVSAQAPRN